MIEKILLYINTFKHLKSVQILYRLIYYIKIKIKINEYKHNENHNIIHEKLSYSYNIPNNNSYLGNNCFNFLNIRYDFGEKINWELQELGKLWQYNLVYFDFLNNNNISIKEKENLILDFIHFESKYNSRWEPYPISLRLINWIRFLSINGRNTKIIIDSIYSQTEYLKKNLEYHILGNHLLENAFALLHASIFLRDESLFIKALNLLKIQLNEQILTDGGHFEQSPMYHNIMLHRVLEVIDILRQKSIDIDLIKSKASMMLSWSINMTFSDGLFPLLNDSTYGVCLETNELIQYAKSLNIIPIDVGLGESGYRRFNKKKYETIVDVGEITASYQPGHSHADIFNFVLNYNNKPLIVDSGISTYESNAVRLFERGTASHNTVLIDDKNQFKVWSSFRVADRASVSISLDSTNNLIASHDGYKKNRHERTFKFDEDCIEIIDIIIGKQPKKSVALFHFYFNVNIKLNNGKVLFEGGEIEFYDYKAVNISSYDYADGYNKFYSSFKVEVLFKEKLKTNIRFYTK